MIYKKLTADSIFDGYTLHKNKALICRQNGAVEDLVELEQAGEDVEQYKGIITPGFINCHCHLELSYLKGMIAPKTGLIEFVSSVMALRGFASEVIKNAIISAQQEMLMNGIVAVGDIINTPHSLLEKKNKLLHYYNFIEASGWLPTMAQERFLNSKNLFESFSHLSPTSLVPHAPYSVSDVLWKLIVPHFEDKVVSIHNQESKYK